MKLRKIRNLSIVPVFLCLLLIIGCAAVIIGVGAGAGAFAYINGKLIRTYESEYHAAISASKETLEDLKIPVIEAVGDELNTVIKAERPDGTPVTIEVERIERNLTEISVRTGAVGVWDRKVSTQIHELIGEKLGHSTYTAPSDDNDLKSVKAGSDMTDVPEEEPNENRVSPEVQKESSPEVNAQTGIRHTPHKDSIVIYFTHDSNELSKEATVKLNRVAAALIENASDQIVINGFSDSTGAASYNTMVSESRANIVKVYLIGKGVRPSRITTRGMGPQKFIASNETEEGRRQNRRVEIEFIRTTAD